MEALENLDVWKRACRLSVSLYQAFTHSKEYGFRDQITRSALSIPSNIAEGFERDSHKSKVQYLKVAKGSCGELWTQLLIGRKAGFLDSERSKELEREAKEISKMLYGLIIHYQNRSQSK
ncbi:four helix bundle protein [Thiohalophilus thiocyanatoxydans]|uniref:Four helix bundle protein n=1 Tax=Thiohalophilus thiocyanatoxydans TaxID=381308 RepID=A0A4R8ITA2_9GAMM|nr:four helix bundle protein [Thiohalophilus thiocyanatoxydans]TDY04272.1 four helix bundle protein [Thiohalophilus thiocyanatoxydans]